ncbi:UNVERIFIED_CONTAM: hypothetical protein GTU68_030602 [Idotea baltica]|nr:hypothetical protein [Idotea baltica]
MDEIIGLDEKIEVLGDGFIWSEGPVWVDNGEFLLFSDAPQNAIFKWKEGEGISEYLKPSGYTGSIVRGGEPGSNGLAIDGGGSLILCQHGDRKIARMLVSTQSPEPIYETLVGTFEGKKFNSPNDLAIHSNGDLYFTDPPYGLVLNMDDPTKEIPYQGIFRLDTDGEIHLMNKFLSRPNGIAISVNESKIYVGNSDSKSPTITEFLLDENGDFNEGNVFFDGSELLKEGLRGSFDGLKVRSDGYIFSTGPGGVLVLTPTGKHIGTISTGEGTSNCAFDTKENYLYITADAYLLRIKLK